jgi:hypothetical protein
VPVLNFFESVEMQLVLTVEDVFYNPVDEWFSISL